MHIPIPAGTVEDTFEHAIEIIAETFRDDPFQRYALIEELQAEGVRDISYELNKAVFSDVIPGMVQDGARSLTTVELSGVASVWYVCRRHVGLGNECSFCTCNLFFFLPSQKKEKNERTKMLR